MAKTEQGSGLGNKPIAIIRNPEEEPETRAEEGTFIAVQGEPVIIGKELASFRVPFVDDKTGRESSADIAGVVDVDPNDGTKLVFSEPKTGVVRPDTAATSHPSKS